MGDSRLYHEAEVQNPVRTPLATSFGLSSHGKYCFIQHFILDKLETMFNI